MFTKLAIARWTRFALFLLLVVASTSCSDSQVNEATPTEAATEVVAEVEVEATSTAEPTETSIPATATPLPTDTATPVPTDTPEPTATPTETPLPTETPEPTDTATPEATATAAATNTPRPTSPPPTATLPPTAPTFPETPIKAWNADEFRSYLGQFRDSLRSFNSEMTIFQQTGKPGDCGTFLGWTRLWIVQSPGYTNVPGQWWALYYEWRSLLKQVADLTVEVRLICGGSGDGSVEAQPLIDFLTWAYPRTEQMVTEAAGIQ